MKRLRWYERVDKNVSKLHNAASLLFGLCLVSAAVLYNSTLQGLIGHREVVREVHVLSGVLSVGAILLGFTPLFRSSVGKVWRLMMLWSAEDSNWVTQWLKTFRRPSYLIDGPNGGQKIGTAVVASSMLVLLITGLILRFFAYFPLWLRVGATLAHTLFAYLITLFVAIHIYYVVSRQNQLETEDH